ncbi:hypothetical protein ACTQ34_17810 [Agathobaculum sp. LCP25S3_E8]|uniref:hypothetical protein n=1 Tax=Agathobaculum sp. LCP25S3_E8 TaxID=3438735 RepID=UPI003F928AB0
MEQSSGKASTRAKNKYRDKTYDRVEITLPKGRKADLQLHAEQRGESLNGFIGRAIEEQVKRDTGITSAGSDSPMIPILPETLESATQAASATGENVPAFIARAVQTQAKRDQTSIDFGINPSTGETINRREGK